MQQFKEVGSNSKLISRGKLVRGVGINDANYLIAERAIVNGKLKRVWICPYYRRWENMLNRAYSTDLHNKNKTYKDVTVCDEWLTFSTFKEWMMSQDWEGKELDKDLINAGNKQYNESNCVFVSKLVNGFTTDSGATRGEFPIGVCFIKATGKFIAKCRNPLTNCRENLGQFDCPDKAHKAWKNRKREIAIELASSDHVQDERVRRALISRYSNDNRI